MSTTEQRMAVKKAFKLIGKQLQITKMALMSYLFLKSLGGLLVVSQHHHFGTVQVPRISVFTGVAQEQHANVIQSKA